MPRGCLAARGGAGDEAAGRGAVDAIGEHVYTKGDSMTLTGETEKREWFEVLKRALGAIGPNTSEATALNMADTAMKVADLAIAGYRKRTEAPCSPE